MFARILDLLRSRKEIALISITIVLIILGFLISEAIKRANLSLTNPNTPQTTNTTEITLPTLTDIPISPSIYPTTAPHDEYSGADYEANKKYLEENPDLLIEERLKGEVPQEFDGFKLDYSYEKDSFIVTIVEPYSENVKKYNDWFAKMGLKDRSHFQIQK